MTTHVCPPIVQVSSSPSSAQLLSILQALLLVNPDRAEVWLALEMLADRATLLAQDRKSVSSLASFIRPVSLGPRVLSF